MAAWPRTWTLALTFAAAACSRGGSPEKVAIVVNGEPITVQEVRAQRDAMRGHDSTRAIEALIDRRLLLQRALARKLDRNPAVAAALANAREQILVRAYLESLADTRYRFDPDAIQDYYRRHAALFAERRVYRFFELAAGGKPEDLQRLNARARQAKTIHEVAAWLEARGMAFNIGAATKPAEQIPPAMLPALAAMSDGEIKVLEIPGGVSVIQMISSQRQPVSEVDAEAQIRQRFWLLAGSEALAEELKWLRAKAQIEYVLERGKTKAAP
jgi:EpsD family peptidyl-prolyl cis-trans isomerase